MRLKRFDKQLQSVFMVLSGLTVLVGLVSVAVNSYLVRLQGEVLAESIAVIERTESVALDADLAVSLAARLGTAGTAQEVADTERTLVDRVSRIRNDVLAMNVFLTGATGEIKEARKALDVVSRMSDAVRRLQAVNASSAESQARLVAAGLSLTDLISRQKNLARLRITAGIWEMYSARDGAGTRHNLDLLADADFFAFERLGELGDAAAAMIRLVQGLSSVARQDDVSVWSADFHASLDLAKARTPFMPSTAARRKAEDDLRILAGAEAEEGLIALQHARLSDVARLDTLSAELRGTLEALAAVAADGRTQVRARMQEGVAAAGRRAVLLTAGLAAAVVVSLVAGHMVWSRTRTRVVLRLNAVAGRIVAVARGETGRPMPISGHDEIGRLEKSINVLRRRAQEAARLRQSLEAAVRARTADVVAEMRSANAARAEAEELGRAKIHFLARMSHEIRTPLNAIMGQAQILRVETPSEASRGRLDRIMSASQHLLSIIDDVLDLSKIEAGKLALEEIDFDLDDVVRKAEAMLSEPAQSKGLRLGSDVDPRLPRLLHGDPRRLSQVIINYGSNAVKFTASGHVMIRISMLEQSEESVLVRFVVEDTGEGIPWEQQGRLFQPFEQLDAATNRRHGGTGLGLSICRHLARLMQGEVGMESEPGRGSTFWFTARLGRVAAAGERAAPSVSAPPAPEAADSGARVLVADDDALGRELSRDMIRHLSGIEVDVVESGVEAVAYAKAGRYDLIFMDMQMPVMDGLTATRRIRELPGYAHTPIVGFTANAYADDRKRCLDAGMNDHLAKPVSMTALDAVLKRWMGERQG